MSRLVLYSSPFVPPEWVAAHGLEPARTFRTATRMTEGLCPIAAGFGELTQGNDDLAIFATTCDQMRRMADLAPAQRTFLLNVPAIWDNPASRELYREELRRLGRFLVRHGGAAPSPEQLTRVMLEHDRARHVLRDADARFIIEPSGLFQTDSELSERRRIALVGGPLRDQDAWIIRTIEESGGCVALDATESGPRTLPAAFDAGRVAQDPLEELVVAYFDTIPCAFRRPLRLLHRYLLKEFARRQIDAIVLVRALWCDLWHAQLPFLREQSGRPVVEIDLGHRDQDLARSRTRLEALLEVLR